MFKKLLQMVVLPIAVLFTMGSSCQIKVPGEKDDRIIIPLDFSTQRPVLELMINDKGPYQFIFDTGSSTNVIDTELANELKFEVIGEDPLRTPGSDNKLISKRVKVPNVNFANTDISEDAVMNTIAIREMVSVDGILCPTFFSKYLLTIDYPGSILSLSIGELDSSEKDVTSFMQSSRVLNLDVFVDGHQLEAHLDSGNPGGFDVPFSMKDKLNFKDEPYEAGVINTPVASFKKWKATLNGDIRIGNIIYENPEISLVEDFQYVNLGYQVFKDLSITVDKKNNLIKFEKPTTGRAINNNEEIPGEKNEYTGWYGGHERKIFLENGEMYLQRGGASKLKLAKLDENLYEMIFNMPVMNELPNIRFKKNASNKVIGLTFLYKDGREDFIKKDK